MSIAVRQWYRDLAMGVRFTFTGGREGWIRALLTAVGVGLGVALLLLTTAIPNVLDTRGAHEDARQDRGIGYLENNTRSEPTDRSLIVADTDTEFQHQEIRGRLLEQEGADAPPPPGLTSFPAPGEMVVSPALADLLNSDAGELLRDRLPYRTAGTIGETGLIGPSELAYYAGAEGLAKRLDGSVVARIDRFGTTDQPQEEMDPILLLLTLVAFVVLLMPVAVFIATAVRFGGERRDRRLAALRLVGSDGRMTRRIAAGEALAGAMLGLVLGTCFFLLGREAVGSVEVFDVSVFPSYLNPSPGLALLVALAVPAAAVLVTLFALRGVVIEPLGVVRTARPARRRLWWRLLPPLGGLALLYPMIGQGAQGGEFNEYMVTGGIVLLLFGVTALLPWVVEAFVARLGSGGLSWQLAVRRLQLSSGAAARMVNGIAVAVAGAIALQMLFAGAEGRYTESTGLDVTRTQMELTLPDDLPVGVAAKELKRAKGARAIAVLSTAEVSPTAKDPQAWVGVTVGDCAALRELATLPSCRDGDVFLLKTPERIRQADPAELGAPGNTLYFDPSFSGDEQGAETAWKLPGEVKQVSQRTDPLRMGGEGLLATPGALPAKTGDELSSTVYVRTDPAVPNALDEVRNAAVAVDPLIRTWEWESTRRLDQFTDIRTGLLVGASAVLVLIGASLLVSQLEQLRERRKLLSALVAFGTRRRTLGLSVLWQTAIPITLGLVLASSVGLALGAVLLKMTGFGVAVDWPGVLSMAGIGAGVVLLVTALSMPPLLRLMRPEGLRTE
ncbi:ABC transporter permease [Streptomyces scabiei]|uniref:ABC transporter permease n=1 Tax=Streptomyces scabiei TaxID=1930 RepID=UPI001B30A27C|nr:MULTISPECIES: ABC transporter permease [Streptomyces]MBP5861500.1 FtsX-like permease family protein [Streptomyces sp. LBUM 1484]MBP5878067.1 FtsX-like permease family protein [Streptomyces sp. LBUM 1477]MBP5885903.1 FtsX-like permease family protein [Streptomyces sp. LBUM 1487]MBP5891264.1 FtsX-like permease family protein [Streptomyces sp. LBUM 1481]MBP5901878.1 FtsX-like permease family protein [Streptomyces sp. LBUM 1488]